MIVVVSQEITCSSRCYSCKLHPFIMLEFLNTHQHRKMGEIFRLYDSFRMKDVSLNMCGCVCKNCTLFIMLLFPVSHGFTKLSALFEGPQNAGLSFKSSSQPQWVYYNSGAISAFMLLEQLFKVAPCWLVQVWPQRYYFHFAKQPMILNFDQEKIKWQYHSKYKYHGLIDCGNYDDHSYFL